MYLNVQVTNNKVMKTYQVTDTVYWQPDFSVHSKGLFPCTVNLFLLTPHTAVATYWRPLLNTTVTAAGINKEPQMKKGS